MTPPRAEPSSFRSPAADSVPARPLALWALLVPIAYAPSLLVGAGVDTRGLAGLVVATALALLSVRSLDSGRAFDRAAAALESPAPLLLLAAIAIFAAQAAARAVLGMAAHGEYAIAGLFGQSFWTLLHGLPFVNSQETVNGSLASHFGIHFSPTLLLLTPFYLIWPHPLTLMVAQGVALALAPLPVFAMLRPRVGGAAALGLSLSLLLLPLFIRAGGGDFHDACFLPAPLLAAVWALEARRHRWFALFLLLALGVREDAALPVAMLGVYAFLRGRGVKLALSILLIGLAWFAIATRVVIPKFWSEGIIIDPRRFFAAAFGHWGATAPEAVRAMLSHPAAVARWLATPELARYGYTLVLPLLLLPPFLDAAALMALPGFAVNLLSRYPFMHSATEPYSYVPLTFFALATMRLATRLAERSGEARRHATGLVAALIVLAGTLPAALAPSVVPPRAVLPAAAARAAIRLIPRDAAVYASIALYPDLCNRRTFDAWWNTGGVPRDRAFRARYAWIVLWPGSDTPGEPREGAMVDSLANDPAFAERPGFEPLRVFQRR